MPQYDLLVKGGEVIDPHSGFRGRRDLAVLGERIAALEPEIPSSQAVRVIDASGNLVVPGLIDLHTHLGFEVHRQVVYAEDHCPPSGVTTAVDMGSTGAFTFPWYKDRVLEPCGVRLLEFINIASIGTIAIHTPYYVAHYGEYIDTQDTLRMIEENRDMIRGIKVFGSGAMVGEWPLPALRAARQVADQVDLPIAVHISDQPPTLEEILELLRSGDIITHSFTPHDQTILDGGGTVRPAVWEARQRGVLFDLGHGSGSFAFDVARKALAQSFLPDAISTDLYYANAESPVKDLLTTVGKLLNLGMDLQDCLARVTCNPARAIREPQLGRLQVGGPADLALLTLCEIQPSAGHIRYVDSVNEALEGRLGLECALTLFGGQIVYEANS